MNKSLLAAALLALPMFAHAESVLPFMKEIAEGKELPPPYGVSVDFFTMNQKYDIDSLAFTLPGVSLSDTSAIKVRNNVRHGDLKFDAWLFPFLNVFAFYGHVSADTYVDLSHVPVTGLPVSLGKLDISYTGQVWGGGGTLAFAVDHWFASLTGTYAHTNVSGDFDSKVHSSTVQPKFGYFDGPWAFWVGGMYLDVKERHDGAIALPGLGSVPFDVSLTERNKFNPAVGARFRFGDASNIHVEFGGGNRKTTLINFDYRFD